MIEFDFPRYCANCKNIRPQATVQIRDDDNTKTNIHCEYREHCARLWRMMKAEKERNIRDD